MKVAAAIKERIANELGDAIDLGGETHHVFPHPRRVLEIDAIEGLSGEKVDRMKAVARAALEGRLDAERLRAMNELDALADLQRIRGVGPWTASHILYRGAAPMDALPSAEPRVLHGFAEAYGTEVPSYEAFARLANAWRPCRMWVSVLLSRTLAAAGGWQKPELARERASAGRDLDLKVRRRAAISSPKPREKAHETMRR
jgi:DNA-3-methyladenine glycosylase II